MKFNLNCDIGESVPGYDLMHDFAILRYVDACNLACGFHAGDAVTASRIIAFCMEYGVKVGAHPSFPDKENFGRQPMDLPFDELVALLVYQIAAIKGLAEAQECSLQHVKAHGALYNMACKQEKEARAVIIATGSVAPNLAVMAPEGSLLAKMTEEVGLKVIYEAFADRNYAFDSAQPTCLSLVSRKEPNAVLYDKEQVLAHLLEMNNEGTVTCIDGVSRPIKADTFCVHGDNPAALEILEFLRRR